MAVEKIQYEQNRTQAAIASDEAAKRYGLAVIKREIANQKDNYTSFVVVDQKGVQYDLFYHTPILGGLLRLKMWPTFLHIEKGVLKQMHLVNHKTKLIPGEEKTAEKGSFFTL